MTARGDRDWRRILIASDLHGPYLDKLAYRAFLAVATEMEWDHCYLNGDIADFSQISSHPKKIGGYEREFRDDISLDEEIHIVREDIFRPLRKALKKTPITMRLGNHDYRWLTVAESNPDALTKIVKAMRKCKSLYLEDIFQMDKFGVQLSYNAVDVLYGTYTLIHGVKTGQGAAKANLLRYGSGTSGHSHRANCYTTVMHGKIQGWWESGCLRTTKNVEYLPMGDRPDWSQAFLELTINAKTGDFFCFPHFVINGRVDFWGKVYG